MSQRKKKNLRRFVAIYLTSSMLFSGIAFADDSDDEHSLYLEGQAITVTESNEYNGVNEIYGGSDKYDGQEHSIDVTNITVESGNVGAVTGGSSAENNTKVHVGTANITINGGNVDYIQGGGEADWKNATATVDTVNITINGGDIGSNPFSAPGDDIGYNGISGGGMAWAGEIDNEENISNVQTVNITITGGNIYKPTDPDAVDFAVLGGGVAGYDGSASNVTASTHVDIVNMNISGGTIYTDVYAGGVTYDLVGEEDSTITSTVDNATINISGGEIKGSVYAGGMNEGTVGNTTISISGGKIGGNVSADLNVTGSSALNFIKGSQSSVDGAISGFDIITVKEGAKTTLTGTNVADGAAVIQAKGVEIEKDSTVTIATSMTFNLGSASSPIPATFSLRSARVGNGVLSLSGELKIMTGAELTLENTTLVSQDTGMVTVGVEKDSSTLTVGKLSMASTR